MRSWWKARRRGEDRCRGRKPCRAERGSSLFAGSRMIRTASSCLSTDRAPREKRMRQREADDGRRGDEVAGTAVALGSQWVRHLKTGRHLQRGTDCPGLHPCSKRGSENGQGASTGQRAPSPPPSASLTAVRVACRSSAAQPRYKARGRLPPCRAVRPNAFPALQRTRSR